MKSKPTVAGIGEFLWDMLPTGRQMGGAPCNFAFHAMQAGCVSHVISAAGSDEPGDDLVRNLKELGLDERLIQRNGFPTGTVTVSLNENGHPDYTIHEQVAWDHIRWTPAMKELAGSLDAVCYGSLAQRNPESKDSILSLILATRPDCIKVFDINLRQHYYDRETVVQSIMLADILKLNEEELPVVAGFTGLTGTVREQLEQLLIRLKLKYIVYTMGSQGSLVIGEGLFSQADAPAVTVADTVGAGDAFTGVFVAGLLQKVPVTQIHLKATETAAYVCTCKGATPLITSFTF